MKIAKASGSKLHKIITWLVYGLSGIPLIFLLRGVNELFEFPKMILVYLIVLLIGFLFFSKRVLTGQFKISNSALSLAVLGFLTTNVLATLFSMNVYTSIWGYYTRFNGGLASIAAFTLLYFVIAEELSNLEKKQLLDFFILTSVPICLYGIAQSFGFQKDLWEGDSQIRIFSTLGQPNWLAAYLVMLIPVTLKKTLEIKESALKIGTGSIVFIQLTALWLTFSLSGLLGLAASLAIYVIAENKKLISENKKVLATIFVALALVCVLKPGVLKPKIDDAIRDLKKRITLERAAYAMEKSSPELASYEYGDTTGIRLIVWQGTTRLILSSPKVFLVGSGPETFPYAFLKFRPESLNITSEWDFIFNKPHNYYLELLANLGIIGFLAYVTLALLAIKGSWARNPALAAGLVGLWVTDFFSWHTVSTALLMFIYLGIIAKHE